jgi:hypothetical protein
MLRAFSPRRLRRTDPQRRTRLDVMQLEDRNTPAITVADLASGASVNSLITTLEGLNSGVTVKNATVGGSSTMALGTFSGAAPVFGFDSGIVLSTGHAKAIIGPNTGTAVASFDNGITTVDPLLQALSPGVSLFDLATLNFDVTSTNGGNLLTFQYVFGSEEYPEFAPPNDSGFPDIFGFFVNGKDVAFLPGTNSPVTINTVNPVTNSADFVSNWPNPKFNTQLDGFTTTLTVLLPIVPGVSNHIELAIADASDGIYDSDVMIKSGSLKAGKITLSNPLRWTYNPATRAYAGSEILANTTGVDIPGPLYVVLSNPPPGMTFLNPSGFTSTGQPYIKVPGTLKAGASLSVLVLLSDPENLALNTYFNVNSISLFNTIP